MIVTDSMNSSTSYYKFVKTRIVQQGSDGSFTMAMHDNIFPLCV